MDDRAALVTAILSESHRPDLSAEVDGFIRRAESLIASKLRCLEMATSTTIEDSDRVTAGEAIFNLPTGCLDVRAIWAPTANGYQEIRRKGLYELRRLSGSADVYWYATRAGNQIEFRGNPSTDLIMDLEYYKRPDALALSTDTNAILQENEDIYLSASLFYLHRYCQDQDIAQGFLDSFNGLADKLNELAAHKEGGGDTAPAYNFGTTASY